MWQRARRFSLLPIGLWLLLGLLAAARPPDPIWLHGVYDAGDFDDLVVQIGQQAEACEPSVPRGLAPDRRVEPLPRPGSAVLVGASRLTVQDRSPLLL